MSSPRRVSDTTVRRLSLYYRVLQKVLAEGAAQVSSDQLAEFSRSSGAQVRRDLASFGNFGIRGKGYDAARLREHIAELLGLNQTWRTVVVGAGRLGTALTSYGEFGRQGFEIVALFDSDPAKVGTIAEGRTVRDVQELTLAVRTEDIAIGVITTPAKAAQDVANRLVAGGVRGIVNFAPCPIVVPGRVRLRTVNLTYELEGLSFAITEEVDPIPASHADHGFEAA